MRRHASVTVRYKRDVLEQLERHGVRPNPSTPPQLVHDFVNDLYRYELRRLRDRLLRKEILKTDYYGRVVEVRERYRLLAEKAWQWIDS